MAITAALIKELREITWIGMMECKKALEETNGDINLAIDELRKKGLSKAAKKADRETLEGGLKIVTEWAKAYVVSVSCETDFLANSDRFKTMLGDIANFLKTNWADSKEAAQEFLNKNYAMEMGENLQISNYSIYEGWVTAAYVHSNGKLAALIVANDWTNEEKAKQVAMHVTATNPEFLSADDISDEIIEKEKSIQLEIMKNDPKMTGKPDEVLLKIIEGKIVSSSVKTSVVADKAGQEYNIGPVSHFTIPGFQGSEKYQSFYAKSDTPMTGGFVGEVAVPSEEDIKKAKENAEKSLRDYFNAFFYSQIPKDFKIIDGADQFKILKEEVNETVDEQGNFSVFIEAEASTIAFRQDDVLSIFISLAKEKLGADFKLNNYEISYNNTISNFDKGFLNALVNFKGTFQPPFDINQFKERIIGKNELELKTLIFSQANIERAKVSLWPFWVKRAPNNLKKVSIELE